VVNLTTERDRLRDEVAGYRAEAPKLRAELADCRTRAEQAEARQKALESMVDDERAAKERAYGAAERLERQLAELCDGNALAEELQAANSALNGTVLELTEALHWEKRARDEGAEGLVQLQQDHAHQKALVLQISNELEAAAGQLGKKTEALDHQCKVNEELRAEIRRLQDQVAGKEAALSQTSEQLEYKESENNLLKVLARVTSPPPPTAALPRVLADLIRRLESFSPLSLSPTLLATLPKLPYYYHPLTARKRHAARRSNGAHGSRCRSRRRSTSNGAFRVWGLGARG